MNLALYRYQAKRVLQTFGHFSRARIMLVRISGGGPGVDVVLDLHHINLPSESVGSVLMLDTLEHVEFPRKAIEEAHRILKKDGVLIMSSVMNFRIHEYPHDYWRFTPEGFQSLLGLFASSFVGSAGEAKFPHTVVGVGWKGAIPDGAVTDFRGRFEQWKDCWEHTSGTRWKKWAKLTVSPIRVEIYRKFRSK